MTLSELDVPWVEHYQPGMMDGESNKARIARQQHERWLAKQATRAESAAAAAERRKQLLAESVDSVGKRRIELSNNPASIRALREAINAGALPDSYVRTGQVVVIEQPTGAALDENEPPEVIGLVDVPKLDLMLAENTFCFKTVREKLADGTTETVSRETTPPQQVTKAVLSSVTWHGLRPLKGIITAPTLRPDGTLVQIPGYDPDAEVFYSPTMDLEYVPDEPTTEQQDEAKDFIFNHLLADFPWVGGSRANFLGILVAPLLRTYLGDALIPLVAIDATSPSTGKSLLALILTRLYSGLVRPWVADDTEFRKAVTSALIDKSGAIVTLDNVGKGETVDQPTLAALLTMKVWTDRVLGISGNVSVPNNRVWIITGNSLTVGGDIASRCILIRLDTGAPNPERRPESKFKLGNLEDYLAKPENRAKVLFHLLVLIRSWVVAGAPTIEVPMRTFTPFASAAAGFVNWLGESGFMTNADSLAEVDEEEARLGAFYARWHHLFGDERMSTTRLVDSATPDTAGMTSKAWNSTFPTRKDGRVPSSVGLGKILSSERGRHRGGYRLNGFYDKNSKVWSYSVTPSELGKPDEAS